MQSSNSSSSVSQLLVVKRPSKVATPLKREDSNIQYGSVSSTENGAPLIEIDRKHRNKCVKVCEFLSKLTIEPVVFCYMLAYFMSGACMSNMMMDKGCLYYFNYSSEVCNNLSQPEYENIKDKVEILGADFQLYFNCMSLIGAFFMIFIAPWSDKYSRKIPLLFALFGVTVTDLGFLYCAIHFELGNEYLLLSKIPSEICGGFICVLTIFYSHASEVSTQQFRTVKYSLVEAAFGLGGCIGGLAGGVFYKYYGYTSIYTYAAALYIFCFLWVIFVVEETSGRGANVSWWKKIKDFFVCENAKAGVKATFRRREDGERKLIILLMASICVVVLTYDSFSNISYIYVHHIYNWDPTIYNFVMTGFSLLGLPVSIILVPLLVKCYKVEDFTFGVIGSLSMMMRNLFISFAKYHTFIYYIGNTVGVLNGLSVLAVRSSISKLVEKEELGRVFSFLATCEATFPIFGSIVLTKIFTLTLDVTPNIAYLVSTISLLIPLCTFIWAIKFTRRKPYLMVPSNDQARCNV